MQLKKRGNGPDFVIVAVRYDLERTHIIAVMAHEFDGETVLPEKEYDRMEVLVALRAGMTVVTAGRDSDDRICHHADVEKFPREGKLFIRTVGNEHQCDNLGELPEF